MSYDFSCKIVDDEIKQFRGIHKAHTKWQLREEKYKDVFLTSFCEISIIKLPRAIKEYQENKQDGMLQWMMFLDNPENKEIDQIMEENAEIKEAKEELDKISQDDLLRRMALKADLDKRDQEQLVYEAERDGKEKGKKEGKIETAKKLLEEGISLEVIMKVTGLTKDEVMEEAN